MLEVYTEKKNREEHSEKLMTFNSFQDLSEWILSLMRRPYSEYGVFQLPDEDFERTRNMPEWEDYCLYSTSRKDTCDDPSTMVIRPDRHDNEVKIHMIVSVTSNGASGILYSDGTYTSGRTHLGEAVRRWIKIFEEDLKHQDFNFIEEELADDDESIIQFPTQSEAHEEAPKKKTDGGHNSGRKVL